MSEHNKLFFKVATEEGILLNQYWGSGIKMMKR